MFGLTPRGSTVSVDSSGRDSPNASESIAMETSDLPTTMSTIDECHPVTAVDERTPHTGRVHGVDDVDDDDNDVCHRGVQSPTHLHAHPQFQHHHHHTQQHPHHTDALNGRQQSRCGGGGLRSMDFGEVGGGIGGSGSFSGGSDVGASSKSKKRPVIHYLPSAGGVKKLGLATVASESVVTGSDRRSNMNGTNGRNQSRRHKPGVVYQVASDYILERNLGFDMSHKPIALHEVASETAMALKTGHCKLHRECSLQGLSWQNLCMQQQQAQLKDGEKCQYKESELSLIANGLPPTLGSKTPHEGEGVVRVSSNTTLDALTGSMMSLTLFPFCRICHMAASDSDEPLISPCRCSGTMLYIHGSCLMKWMDICSRKSRKTQRCELCRYQYSRQKRFQFKEWKMPRSSRRDKLLHLIFLLNLIVMVGCAVATVYCFLSDTGMTKRSRYSQNYMNQGSSSTQGIFLVGGVSSSGGGSSSSSGSSGSTDSDGGLTTDNNHALNENGAAGAAEMTLTANDVVRPSDEGGSGSRDQASDPRLRGRVDLTPEEVVTLCCGVLFFISFFVAMYAQIKAKHTLYQLFVRFTVLNTKWEIAEYNPANDPLLVTIQQKSGKDSNQTPVMV